MKRNDFFFISQSYALCLLLVCSSFILHAQTQLKKWYLDTKLINFEANPPLVEDMINLTPPATVGVTTDGATNGIYSPEGNMLLYVDKNLVVYNELGGTIGALLIGLPGISNVQDTGPEIQIVPVPGSSCKYYIIYSITFTNTPGSVEGNIYYSEVDLTLNGGLGGFVIQDIALLPSPLSSGPIGGFAVGRLRSDNTRFLYHASNSNDNNTGCKLRKFTISSISIADVEVLAANNNDRAYGNVEVEISNDQSKLAFATFKPDASLPVDVFIFHLDSDGDLDTSTGNNGITGIDLTSTTDGLTFTGCEFSADGNKLYVGAWGDGIYEVDISDLNNISSTFIVNSESYSKSQIEKAYNGQIYVARSSTELGFIDDFTSSSQIIMVDQINTGTASIVTNQISFHWGFPVFTIPDQMDGFDYNLVPECCPITIEYEATEYIVSSNTNWTATDNDFANTSIVRIFDELRISNNSTLTITDMEFQFAEGAKVIVEKGSRLNLNNTIMTTTECENVWEGIQVRGDKMLNQYGANNQGIIVLDNATIEHSVNAVRMYSTENISTTINKTGGVIIARNETKFLNNQRGVQFNIYENTNFSGQHAGNLSSFIDCTFRIDDDYRFEKKMDGHIKMWGVDGILIRGCTFEHTQDVMTASDRSYAIRSYNAGFDLRAYCSNFGQAGDPCMEWNWNTFSGFYHAISAQNGNSAEPYHIYSIDRASFDQNVIGVYSTAVSNSTIVRSVFNVGNFVAANYAGLAEGIYLNTGTGYTIEQNNFVDMPTQGGIELGVRAYNTGPDNNEIYNNSFTGFLIGNLAQRQNRENPNEEDGLNGLRYFCNTNVGNFYDFYVTSISAPDHGIATNQGVMPLSSTGNAILSAANTFSHNVSDFRNLSTQNPVINWHTSGEDIPSVNLLNTYNNGNAVNSNTCPDNFTDGDVMLVLSPGDFNQLATYFNDHETTVDSLKNQLSASIDNGDTQATVNTINAWSKSGSDLVLEMATISPFLSSTSLEAVIDRYDILTDQQRHDVLAANPAELRNETLFEYNSNSSSPLPPSYIASLKLAGNNFYDRSVLEGEISARKASMGYIANKLLTSILSDSTKTFTDIRTWLAKKGGLDSELAIAETYISEGDHALATQYINNIGSTYNLSGASLDKYNQFQAIKTLQMQLADDGRTWAELDSIEMAEIEVIAETDAGFPTAQAQGVLSFFYDYVYESELDLGGANQNNDAELPSSFDIIPNSVTIYPNPAGDWITFQFDQPLQQNSLLTLSNINGEVVRSIDLEKGEVRRLISTNVYPVGTYFYQLFIDGEHKFGKIVLMK